MKGSPVPGGFVHPCFPRARCPLSHRQLIKAVRENSLTRRASEGDQWAPLFPSLARRVSEAIRRIRKTAVPSHMAHFSLWERDKSLLRRPPTTGIGRRLACLHEAARPYVFERLRRRQPKASRPTKPKAASEVHAYYLVDSVRKEVVFVKLNGLPPGPEVDA